MARILSRTERPLSPWVRLVENTVELAPGAPPERYHSLAQADYVTIVARTPSGRIPIVSQYRPAIDAITWELPSGMLDDDEPPATCAARELHEEAGVTALHLERLGTYLPDPGRLENRLHIYAAEVAEPDPDFVAEPGMTIAFVTADELRARILEGSFDHQLHIGALATAELHGFALGLFGRH